MSTSVKTQLLLLVLILGFLTGPRVVDVVRRISAEALPSPQSAGVIESSIIAKEVNRNTKISTSTDPFFELNLEAKSVYVWDIQTHRKIYGYNEFTKLPLASVTKVMMALVATELLPPDTEITIAPVDLKEEGNSGLFVGEKWKLSDLLNFTLIASSNDGASAIASVAGSTLLVPGSDLNPLEGKKLFIDKMNRKARTIGLESTYFSNESGLDLESMASGAYGSSRDMAMLFEYVFKHHPQLFSGTSLKNLEVKSASNITHHVLNTNQDVAKIPGIIGSKTGYTDLAGGNLVVIVDIGINHPVVFSVLGSTHSGRFNDIDKLLVAVTKSITEVPKAVE